MLRSSRLLSLALAAGLVLCSGCLSVFGLGGSKKRPAPPPGAAAPSTMLPPAAATPPPPAPVPPVTVAVSTQADANGGNAVRVRVYVLGGETAFLRATQAALWADGARVLGADLLAVHDLVLYPRDARTLDLRLEPGAAFIGVAADFRRPDADGWRLAVPAAAGRASGVRLLVGAGRLTLQP